MTYGSTEPAQLLVDYVSLFLNEPLPGHAYGAILVFRYLHRPLIPCIKKALRNGGLLIYEIIPCLGKRLFRDEKPARQTNRHRCEGPPCPDHL